MFIFSGALAMKKSSGGSAAETRRLEAEAQHEKKARLSQPPPAAATLTVACWITENLSGGETARIAAVRRQAARFRRGPGGADRADRRGRGGATERAAPGFGLHFHSAMGRNSGNLHLALQYRESALLGTVKEPVHATSCTQRKPMPPLRSIESLSSSSVFCSVARSAA